MEKNKGEGFLLDVAPSNFFILSHGVKIKNLVELAESLRTISDKVFEHHVNSYKNDFSNWIRDVIKDNELADNISKARSKNEIIDLIEKKISEVKERNNLKSVKIKKHLNSIERILEKEKEIDFREKKIQEIEERIEEKLRNMPNKEDVKKQNNLFSKDFIQGIVVGMLLVLLGFVIYWKFFIQ